MALFDWKTSIGFGTPTGTLGAKVRDLTTGTILRARQTTAAAVTLDTGVVGTEHYVVGCTAAAGLQLDDDWGPGIQVILEDDNTTLVYDIDHIIAAERLRRTGGGGGGGGSLTAEQAEWLEEIHRGIQSIGAAPAFV